MDATFAGATISGPTYAQPLYLASNGTGPDLVIAVTEQNRVYAFNAASGAQMYNVLLGPPLPRSQLASLGTFCGNIDPLGTTGTPVIDEKTRTIYLDAMTSLDGTAASARHQVYAVNADTGAVVSGWPVDLNARVPTTGGTSFNSLVQNQRGALALLGGKVFVPFGGHIGDCSTYHGWVVGISTTDPTQVSAWATRALAGGIWAPGGIASDGTSLFVVTGNTEANPNNFAPPSSWQDGEAVFRLSTSLGAATQNADYFAPTNWSSLDSADQDLGGANALLIDVPGATPSSLIVALGKDGRAYALNRANLGGISAPASMATVSTGSIITAPAAYTTASGAFVVFKGNGSGCPSGQSGGLTAVKIGAASPPTLKVAWCAGPASNASVAVSMSNEQGQDALVWIVGTDNKLHAVDGDTGANVFNGGSSSDNVPSVQRFIPPIIANGRVFVAANSQVYAFSP
jgi:outer membrane protein assembly factor BamB